MPFQEKPRSLALAVILFGCLALIGSWMLPDYGISWDAEARFDSGERKFAYYETLLKGSWEEASSLRGSSSYTGFFDILNACLRRLFPFGWVEVNNALVLAFGMAGVAGTFFAGRLVGGPWVGMLAALLLVLTPRYTGHAFMNPKDIPFAATYIWGLWALIRCHFVDESKPLLKRVLLFGLLAGLCAATRIGGLLLPAYAGLIFGIEAVRSFLHDRSGAMLRRKVCLGAIWFLGFLTCMLVLFLFWPAAHGNPLSQTGEAIEKVSAYGWFGRVFFLGEYWTDLPWFYLPLMFLITLPPLTLVGIGAFGVFVGHGMLPGRRKQIRDLFNGPVTVLLLAVLFPLAYIILRNSQVYDGIRHVLFILPPLTILAAMGINRLVQWIGERLPRTVRPGWTWAPVVLIGFLPLIAMIRLHPYQYMYYNFLAGGLRGAAVHFDTDYWGLAYREATEVLQDEFFRDTRGPVLVTPIPPLRDLNPHRANTPVPPGVMVSYWLRDPFRYVPHADPADVYIATTRYGYNEMVPLEPVYSIQREGVTLIEVFDVSRYSRIDNTEASTE